MDCDWRAVGPMLPACRWRRGLCVFLRRPLLISAEQGCSNAKVQDHRTHLAGRRVPERGRRRLPLRRALDGWIIRRRDIEASRIMKQSPLLEFESSAFAVVAGEDDATNAGLFGKALAEWLAGELRVAGIAAGGVIAEDFGWCVPVSVPPHRLH